MFTPFSSTPHSHCLSHTSVGKSGLSRPQTVFDGGPLSLPVGQVLQQVPCLQPDSPISHMTPLLQRSDRRAKNPAMQWMINCTLRSTCLLPEAIYQALLMQANRTSTCSRLRASEPDTKRGDITWCSRGARTPSLAHCMDYPFRERKGDWGRKERLSHFNK